MQPTFRKTGTTRRLSATPLGERGARCFVPGAAGAAHALDAPRKDGVEPRSPTPKGGIGLGAIGGHTKPRSFVRARRGQRNPRPVTAAFPLAVGQDAASSSGGACGAKFPRSPRRVSWFWCRCVLVGRRRDHLQTRGFLTPHNGQHPQADRSEQPRREAALSRPGSSPLLRSVGLGRPAVGNRPPVAAISLRPKP
jgi:hypothetical protein